MRVVNVGGYDLYNPVKKHESGNYIVFKFLREIGIDTNLLLTRCKATSDPDVHRVDTEGADFVNSIGPHDYIIYHDESVSPKKIKEIHDNYGSKIIFITQTHCVFTGGCAFSLACERYTDSCGKCPQKNSDDEYDSTFLSLKDKKEYFSDLPITLVVGSENSYLKSNKSPLFSSRDVIKIPLPNDVPFCRDQKILLWGTTQPRTYRKGFGYFEESLVKLLERKRISANDFLVLAVGPGMQSVFSNLQNNYGIRVVYTGYVDSREQMAEMFKLADFSVCTTVDDAGPMVISESMINFSPVVAFDASISLDLIESNKTGFISSVGDTENLALNIEKMLLLSDSELENMSKNGSLRAKEFHSKEKISKLWKELLK